MEYGAEYEDEGWEYEYEDPEYYVGDWETEAQEEIVTPQIQICAFRYRGGRGGRGRLRGNPGPFRGSRGIG